MPLPIPMIDEDKESFIKRFMSDEKMMMEYPEEKQRYAVAETQWAGVDRYNASGVDEGCWMLSQETLQATENEQTIKVFPRGTYFIQKYGKDVQFDDKFFGEISTAFSSKGLSKPKIDKDHEFKTSFGDILQPEIKSDGMYFKIKLNPKGVELVKNREYNYISPAWGRTKGVGQDEYPNRLLAVSLVNFPALEGALPSLQDQLRLSKFEMVQEKKSKEAKMELYVLANELGLNSEASLEVVHGEVKALKAKVTGYETETVELKTKLSAAEDTAIKLSQEIKEIKDAELKKEAFDSVRKWIELGKVHPAIQDIVIERYCLNKEATQKEMDMIPEKVYEGQKASNTDVSGIDPEISVKMLKAGLDPKNKEDVEIFMSVKGGK